MLDDSVPNASTLLELQLEVISGASLSFDIVACPCVQALSYLLNAFISFM